MKKNPTNQTNKNQKQYTIKSVVNRQIVQNNINDDKICVLKFNDELLISALHNMTIYIHHVKFLV